MNLQLVNTVTGIGDDGQVYTIKSYKRPGERLGRVDSRFLSFSKGFGASATGWMAIPNRSWPETPRIHQGMLRIDCPHDLVLVADTQEVRVGLDAANASSTSTIQQPTS